MSVAELTWSERVARSHAIESADDWQYGVVWRFARAGQGVEWLGPPAGDGWEVNTDYGDRGQAVRVPAWSDGEVIMQLTHWRRSVPGCNNGWLRRTVHERVRYDGDPRADER